MKLKITNPVWTQHGSIDVIWDHPDYGPIPYTVMDRSGEDEMQSIWDNLIAGDYGEILPYTPDPDAELEQERSNMVVSRFQAKAALTLAGLMPQVEEKIATADPLVQLAWAEAVEFKRNSPSILLLADLLDLSDLEVDDLFRTAMTIKA